MLASSLEVQRCRNYVARSCATNHDAGSCPVYMQRKMKMRASLVALMALAAALWALAPADAAGPRARATATCSGTYVRATVLNQTNLRMDPSFVGHGLTNAICSNARPRSIQPGSKDRWQIGDNFFSTSVTIRYRLTNGDVIELHGFVEKGNHSSSLDCGWTTVVSSPRAFDCRVNWEGGALQGQAVIELRVFPRRAPPPRAATRPLATSATTCQHKSALIGTTTNETDVPLTLVSLDHGAADGWCRRPSRSQPAHSARRWKLGGPRSGASLHFIYRLPNRDDLEFAAKVDPRGGSIGCAPVDRAHARPFGCRAARRVAPGSETPSVDLQVFRVSEH